MSIEICTDTCNQPAKVHSIKSQCLPLILSEQCCRAFSRILMSDKLMVKTLVDASCRGLFTSTRLSCVLFHSTSSSKISVIVSWYSSTASSTPLVCWSHWWRAPSMIAKTRAKPTKNDITKTPLLITSYEPSMRAEVGNIGLRSWQNRPSTARSFQKRPRVNIPRHGSSKRR